MVKIWKTGVIKYFIFEKLEILNPATSYFNIFRSLNSQYKILSSGRISNISTFRIIFHRIFNFSRMHQRSQFCVSQLLATFKIPKLMKLSQGCIDRLQVAMKILEIKMKHFLAWKRKGPLITVWEATDNTSLIVTNSQGTVIDYTLEILNDSQSDTLGESACEKNRQVARTNSNFSSFKEKKKKRLQVSVKIERWWIVRTVSFWSIRTL